MMKSASNISESDPLFPGFPSFKGRLKVISERLLCQSSVDDQGANQVGVHVGGGTSVLDVAFTVGMRCRCRDAN